MVNDEAAKKKLLASAIKKQVRATRAMELWNKFEAESPEQKKQLDEHVSDFSLRQRLSALDLEELWNLYNHCDLAYSVQGMLTSARLRSQRIRDSSLNANQR